MKAREFLLEIRRKDYEIKDKMYELSELRSRYGINGSSMSDSERVQTSLTADKMSDLIGNIIELEFEIDNMIDDLADYKKTARRVLSLIDNENYQDVLYRRYFLYESLTEIACVYGKKKETVKKTTDRALIKLQEILDVVFE